MNKALINLFVLLVMSISSTAQISTAGLIGQWRFNGNTADSSGNSLHGAPAYISYTEGISGDSNTAALFNGDSSYVILPYNYRMNLNQFSICAVVRLDSFYQGLCQANYILCRGTDHTTGHYSLLASDNTHDGGNCNKLDTTKFVFYGNIKNKLLSTSINSQYQYTPTINTGQWYCVISTFDGDTNRIYIDGVLKVTVVMQPTVIGTSNEGLTIGANFNKHSQYPYWWKGPMDEVRLYDRVLTPDEVPLFCLEVAADTMKPDTTDTTTSIHNQYNLQRNLAIYPNPAKDRVHISGTTQDKMVRLSVLNTMGQVVIDERVATEQGKLNTAIDVGHLTPGVYVLRVIGNEHSATKVLILER